ncbi:MAG: hypothetical protein HZA31_10605 [Opitutae bacterium]|nr:hypothetical protein [Opitutae bacterium]
MKSTPAMKTHFLLLVAGLILSTLGLRAETAAIAHPVIGQDGFVVYQVDKILRLEGEWTLTKPIKPGQTVAEQTVLLYEGMLLRPAKPVSLKGMEGRIGEAVIVFFPHPGNPAVWRGCHVHNGHVPAYGGIAAADLIDEIENAPMVTPADVAPAATQNYRPVDIRTLLEMWRKAARQTLATSTTPAPKSPATRTR